MIYINFPFSEYKWATKIQMELMKKVQPTWHPKQRKTMLSSNRPTSSRKFREASKNSTICSLLVLSRMSSMNWGRQSTKNQLWLGQSISSTNIKSEATSVTYSKNKFTNSKWSTILPYLESTSSSKMTTASSLSYNTDKGSHSLMCLKDNTTSTKQLLPASCGNFWDCSTIVIAKESFILT